MTPGVRGVKAGSGVGGITCDIGVAGGSFILRTEREGVRASEENELAITLRAHAVRDSEG